MVLSSFKFAVTLYDQWYYLNVNTCSGITDMNMLLVAKTSVHLSAITVSLSEMVYIVTVMYHS